MARADNSTVTAIKARLDLADVVKKYVDLRRVGARWVAPCPFHHETKPSFSVNAEDGFYYCFGCQASGDIFDFYGRINGLDFKETLEQLAAEAGVDLPRDGRVGERDQVEKGFRSKCFDIYRLASERYQENLASQSGRLCREYLAKRRVAPEIIQRFKLGFSSSDWHDLENFFKSRRVDQDTAIKSGMLGRSAAGHVYDRFRGRLIFPIESLSARVIAFGGRAITSNEDEPKYINSPDTPIYKKGEHLFGLAQARAAIAKSRRAILTEGYMDVLTLHQFGYENACGVLGTAMTGEQAHRLAGFCSDIDLVFDGDAAGRKAAQRAARMLLLQGLKSRVVILPEGEDIDSLLHAQGRTAVDDLLAQAGDGLDYCLDVTREQSPAEISKWASDFLGQLADSGLVAYYIPRLAAGLGLSEAILRDQVAGRSGAGQARPAPGGSGPAKETSPQADDPGLTRIVKKQERDFIAFMVRYPDSFLSMKDRGAGDILRSGFARQVWRAFEEHGPEAAFSFLDEEAKRFWIEAAAVKTSLDQAAREEERAGIVRWLDKLSGRDGQAASMARLRRLGATNELDAEALCAIHESVRRKHGQQ